MVAVRAKEGVEEVTAADGGGAATGEDADAFVALGVVSVLPIEKDVGNAECHSGDGSGGGESLVALDKLRSFVGKKKFDAFVAKVFFALFDAVAVGFPEALFLL